jgi:hypothetical protein
MEVRYHSDIQWRRRGWLKFDLSSISGTVASAKLRMYCYEPDTESDDMKVYLCNDDDWDESTITGVNEPTDIGAELASFDPDDESYCELDITSAVSAEAAGDGEISLKIDGTNGNRWVQWYTKENGSNMPELVVVTTETGQGAGAWQAAVADLDRDGYDDLVYVAGNKLTAYDMQARDTLWTASLGSEYHDTTGDADLQCRMRPIIADMDGDSVLDIVVYVMDNAADDVNDRFRIATSTTLDIYKGSDGTRMSRRHFRDNVNTR